MNVIEYKKNNYVMSIYQNENDRIHNLSFSESSHLYVIKLVKNYNENVKSKIKFQKTNIYEKLISIDEVKIILKMFFIIRFHQV